MRRVYHKITDTFIEYFNLWLSSRAGFMQAILISVIWTGFVLSGLDKHGFIYLYIATEFSFITQFTLAIISSRAKRDAQNAAEVNEQLLRNQANMMTLIIALAEQIQKEIEDQEVILEELVETHEAIHNVSDKVVEVQEDVAAKIEEITSP